VLNMTSLLWDMTQRSVDSHVFRVKCDTTIFKGKHSVPSKRLHVSSKLQDTMFYEFKKKIRDSETEKRCNFPNSSKNIAILLLPKILKAMLDTF
jgi:hypothetical protein